MHPYATDSDERIRVPLVLAGVSVAVAYLIHLVVEGTQLKALWWLDIPAVPGVYFLLWGLFDKVLWKYPIFGSIELVRVPDLSGNWKGILKSSYDQFKTEHEIQIQIQQDWTHILVTLRTVRSRSDSVIGGITIRGGSRSVLSYEYLNEPNVDATDTMQMHRGMTRLELVNPTTLEGEYFTGRGRMNVGIMHVERVA